MTKESNNEITRYLEDLKLRIENCNLPQTLEVEGRIFQAYQKLLTELFGATSPELTKENFWKLRTTMVEILLNWTIVKPWRISQGKPQWKRIINPNEADFLIKRFGLIDGVEQDWHAMNISKSSFMRLQSNILQKLRINYQHQLTKFDEFF